MTRRENRRRGARTLLALALLALVLPTLFLVWLGFRTYEQHESRARDLLTRTAAVAREHAIKVFETHELAAQQVDEILFGLSDSEIRLREAELSPRFKAMVDRLDQIQDIWVLDRFGRPLVTGNVYPVPPLDLSDREYYRAHRDGQVAPDDTFVSAVLRGRAQDVIFFQLSDRRRSREPMDFTGVTAISVEPGYFQDFFEKLAGNDVQGVALLRADGSVLAWYPGKREELPDSPRAMNIVEPVRANPDRGTYEARSVFDGSHRLIAYERISTYPVYVTTSLEKRVIRDRWMAEYSQHLILGIPALLALFAALAFALILSRRQTATYERLLIETTRRQATERQMQHLQKLEAIGQLTGGIAHDFNNMLAIIGGSLRMMQRRIAQGDMNIGKYLDSAIAGADRAAALTARLLAFSRQHPLDPEPVDCNSLVTGMSDLLRRTLPESIQIETVLAAGLWKALADPSQLENAVVNLAVNARDAMPDGGKLTIETGNVRLDEAYVSKHQDVTAGDYVLLGITDTGTGMPPEVQAKALDPFFTTKPVGQGSGLGLSQVYGFAKQSGGHLSIYSEPGHGTSVKIYLPRAASDADVPGKPEISEKVMPSTRNETILVVEDEGSVRQLTVAMLQDLGYRVVSAADGVQALSLLDDHPDIALIFTDIVMPHMNGRQLAEKALAIKPSLKVLYTTGYTRNAIVHNGVLDPDVTVVMKPFTLERLSIKLRELLDTGDGKA